LELRVELLLGIRGAVAGVGLVVNVVVGIVVGVVDHVKGWLWEAIAIGHRPAAIHGEIPVGLIYGTSLAIDNQGSDGRT
jgi:hypothetical protein